MKKSIIIFVLFTVAKALTPAYCQQQLTLQVDNDQFNINNTDRYYTQGFLIQYLGKKKDSSFLGWKMSQPVGKYFSLSQKIFTPREITFFEPERHDRPYAATFTLSAGYSFYPKRDLLISTKITAGILGPAALGKQVQQWWHKSLNIFVPRGWDSQIGNSPVINMHLGYNRHLIKGKYISLANHLAANLGTVYNNIEAGGLVTIGKNINRVQPFNEWQGLAIIDNSNKLAFQLIGGLAMRRVFHNSLLQGNIIGRKNDLVRQAAPWVFRYQFGMQVQYTTIIGGLAFNGLSREIYEGKSHQYTSLFLGISF